MSSEIVLADPFPRVHVSTGAWRGDGWQNSITGYGTTYDKTMYGTPSSTIPYDQVTLSNMYDGDDICARIIDTIPDECLRKAYSLQIDEKPLEDKLSPEQALELAGWELNEKFLEADKWGRLHGGGAIVIDFVDGAPDKPLRDKVPGIAAMSVFDRWWLSPHTFYTDGPKRNQPETYFVHAPGSALPSTSRVVHETRMVLFRGVTTGHVQRQRLNYWDFSVMQRIAEIVRAFATGFKAVEILLTDGPQACYGIKGFKELIGAGGQEKLARRMQLIDFMRSALRAVVFDKDNESFDRSTVSFSGIDTILDKLMLRLASAARMPVTILMGQSPAGMNATGDSDFRWFYDTITSRQQNYVKPRLLRLHQLVLRSMGVDAKELEIKFRPLWEPTAKEAAEIDKIKADTAAVLMGAQVMTPEEYALAPCFDAEEWGVDVDARRAMRDAMKKPVEGETDESDETETDKQDPAQPGAVPPGGAPAIPGAPPPNTPIAEDVQKTALNGAQVTSLIDLVAKVANKEIPAESAVQIITLSFPVTEAQARAMVTPAEDFEPPKEEPPVNAFGQPGAAPPGAPADPADPAAPGKPPPFGAKKPEPAQEK
jgi:uncharacterized protein